MATDIGGVWRTVGGRRIFIKDGEDLKTAMKKSGKFKNKKEKNINNKEDEPKEFKDSKIRDENGNLLTVYHGTNEDFEEFDFEKSGSKGLVAYGKGVYFTPDKEVANRFGQKTKEVYLNVKKPFIIQNEEQLNKLIEFKKEAFQKKIDVSEVIKSKGYDGVISYEDIGSDTIHEIVVYDKKQIKIKKK